MRPIFTWLILSLLILVTSIQAIHACATVATVNKLTSKNLLAWKTYWKNHQSQRQITENNLSWGGNIPENWQAEAVLANAVTNALNEAWKTPDVKEVLVAIPAKMLYSNLRPYGDGQTNAAISFGKAWNQKQPQLVATLILLKSGGGIIKFRFHHSLYFSSHAVNIVYYLNGLRIDKRLTSLHQTSNGDTEVEWRPETQAIPAWGNFYQNNVAYVQPDGWKDWFPIDFRDVVKSNEDMLKQLPIEKCVLGKGTLLDPENVSVQGQQTDEFPFLKMGDPLFGKDINGDRYFPVPGTGIHDNFPSPDGNKLVTAVGRGNTLVFVNHPAPFKLAYICFDARNTDAEKKYGVPSGSGWHEIGDPVETVLNSLENEPIIFGYANGKPGYNTPTGTYAYGLTDIVVVRKLFPGYALMAAAGYTTLKEDSEGGSSRGKGPAEGRNYHWYIFNQEHEVCAVEWIHPCIPSQDNHLGFMCNKQDQAK